MRARFLGLALAKAGTLHMPQEPSAGVLLAPGPPRLTCPGALHHVTLRRDNREFLFEPSSFRVFERGWDAGRAGRACARPAGRSGGGSGGWDCLGELGSLASRRDGPAAEGEGLAGHAVAREDLDGPLATVAAEAGR